MYQKSLIPLDGSALAECSVDHAINLSQRRGVGEVILLIIFLTLYLDADRVGIL